MDKTEKTILNEEKQIELAEKKILAEEGVIIKTIESPEFRTVLKTATVLQDIGKMRKNFVRKIARHKFIFTLVVSTGIILVWRGIWEITETMPLLSQSFVALLVGIALLWLIERYSDLN